jgi:hypothetical protein
MVKVKKDARAKNIKISWAREKKLIFWGGIPFPDKKKAPILSTYRYLSTV